MTEASRKPHSIQAEFESVEEYQAPPRDHEQDDDAAQPQSGASDPVEVSLLEAQGRREPGMSETKFHPAADPPITVSGKDELSDPADPRATPPGERM